MGATLSMSPNAMTGINPLSGLQTNLPSLWQNLPSITEMQKQLEKCGVLLHDITVQPSTKPLPLQNLQPAQLQKAATLGEIPLAPPAPAVVSPTNELPPIELASTAPGNPTITIPDDETSSTMPYLILISGIVTLMVVVGLFVMRSVAMPNLFSFLDRSQYVEQDATTLEYEAVWYQE